MEAKPLHVEFKFTDESKTVVRFELPPRLEADADGMTRLTNLFIKVRSAMEPQFSETPPPKEEMHIIGAVDMGVGTDDGQITLSFLHPGMGWIQCRLSTIQARPMAAHLAKLLGQMSDPARH